MNSEVDALALSGHTVYVSGFFTTVGGQERNYLAAIDTTTGAARPMARTSANRGR